MDSGNSTGGNLHSSSGGDEEYDSRAAVHSLFMPFDSLRPLYAASPPPLFDPFSNYLQLDNPNPIPLNPNTPWPRPDSNPIIFQAPMAAAIGEVNVVDHLGKAQNQNTAARNPRKRPRASRRAPTTVLTTDSTNFRAMVQEFTGIPAPPFNTLSMPRSAAFEPPYLLRPFAQKPQSPLPFLVSSASTSTIPFNYHQPITQNSNLFSTHNPNSLASLLHSNPKFLFSKPHDQDSFVIPTSDSHHDATSPNGLPNLVSPDQMGSHKDSNYDNPSSPPIGFRAGKDSEKRSQGMVETWISSSSRNDYEFRKMRGK